MEDMSKKFHTLDGDGANGHLGGLEAASNLQAVAELKKKRNKLAVYAAGFVVFQTAGILVFALTVMRVKSPKLRFGENITVEKLETTTGTSPSFDLRFVGEVRVKNTNFGAYKFDEGNVTFFCGSVSIGNARIPKGTAKFRSTNKQNVTVELNYSAMRGAGNLRTELNSTVLTLNAQVKLRGKVELMLVVKKEKSADMNCTITFDTSKKMLEELCCK